MKKIYLIPIIFIFIFIYIYLIVHIILHYSYKKSHENMYYKNPRDHIIPKVCHQTWHTRELCPEIQKVIENNKLKNPDIEFKLYTDNDMDVYIKENFDNLTYTAYKKINPKYGAALADFFRYCVLYIDGGIYLDIKS